MASALGRSEQRHQMVSMTATKSMSQDRRPQISPRPAFWWSQPGRSTRRHPGWTRLPLSRPPGLLWSRRDPLSRVESRCLGVAGRVWRKDPMPADGLVESRANHGVVVVSGCRVPSGARSASAGGQPGVELVQVQAGQSPDVLLPDRVGLDAIGCPGAARPTSTAAASKNLPPDSIRRVGRRASRSRCPN
jgi:hypothetical protein